MTKFLTSKDYPWLCNYCKDILDQHAGVFQDGLMEDTDDPEAPAMKMYDEGLYCGGDHCKKEEEDG